MRKLLLAGLTAALVAAPVAANAVLVIGTAPAVSFMQAQTDGGQDARAGYEGGCTLNAVGTGGVWTAVATIAVVSTFDGVPDPLLPVDSATCDITVDNQPPIPVPMPVFVSQRGTAVGAGEVQFVASDDSTVVLCANVTIGGVAIPQECEAVEITQVPPQEVLDAFDDVIQRINDTVIAPLDPTLCQVFALLGQLPPVLHPTILYIDPGQGDIYVLGSWFWDCPPYGF